MYTYIYIYLYIYIYIYVSICMYTYTCLRIHSSSKVGTGLEDALCWSYLLQAWGILMLQASKLLHSRVWVSERTALSPLRDKALPGGNVLIIAGRNPRQRV